MEELGVFPLLWATECETFCLHSISFCWNISFHFNMRTCSMLMESWVMSPLSHFVWICAIFSSSACFPLKIFPKTSWFEDLSQALRCFNLAWNRYILVPLVSSGSCHQCLILEVNSGWLKQNFSNLKGLFLGVPRMAASRVMGQWSEPPQGIMLDSTVTPQGQWLLL